MKTWHNIIKYARFIGAFHIGFFILLNAQGIIVDHTSTDITRIPESAIRQASATLHIGYGHTSHGSQLTTGMTGLVEFANNGGKGLALPKDIFAWNNGGINGALDLEEGAGYSDGWLDHDAGYYPGWVNATRAYLDDPSHADVNVIIWAWCGQVGDYSEQDMIDKYLAPMSQLEEDYPDVTFVYMNGHSDGTGDQRTLHRRNMQIRNYCVANNKVFYDFYDIECYDPDGNYYGDKYVSDDCSYAGGNWAIEWQNSHVEGVDWYDCPSAHSQPLNANQKAYAAWWLWASIAGWNGVQDIQDETVAAGDFILKQNYPNPFNPNTTIEYTLKTSAHVRLTIYDANGRQVALLRDEVESPGSKTVRFSGSNLSSGVYFYRLQVDNKSMSRRMVLLK